MNIAPTMSSISCLVIKPSLSRSYRWNAPENYLFSLKQLRYRGLLACVMSAFWSPRSHSNQNISGQAHALQFYLATVMQATTTTVVTWRKIIGPIILYSHFNFSSSVPRDVILSARMNSSNSIVPSLFSSNVWNTNLANFSEFPCGKNCL